MIQLLSGILTAIVAETLGRYVNGPPEETAKAAKYSFAAASLAGRETKREGRHPVKGISAGSARVFQLKRNWCLAISECHAGEGLCGEPVLQSRLTGSASS